MQSLTFYVSMSTTNDNRHRTGLKALLEAGRAGTEAAVSVCEGRLAELEYLYRDRESGSSRASVGGREGVVCLMMGYVICSLDVHPQCP